ncbi:MAG: VacJ family lipoprotein [Rhizobiales bacterium]|nr:VacJ family lipoprotein [Hyphomicrobiales bacterium]
MFEPITLAGRLVHSSASPANARTQAGAWAGVARQVFLVIAGFQLAACSLLGSDFTELTSGSHAVPELVALAPSIDPQNDASNIIYTDEAAPQLTQLYDPPTPTSTGSLGSESASIQGVAIVEDAPAQGEYEIAYVDPGDPWEDFNRRVFRTSNAIDEIVIEPVARTYRHLFPHPVRVAVRNFASNLESPVTLANDLMQGEVNRAHVTFTRLMINSTIGIAGFHDAAAEMGYEAHREDFDQTLALHGWPSGPYMVVPLIGPSTPRHLVGRVVDSLFHPLTWILGGEPYGVVLAERAARGIVAREEVLDTIDATRSTSTDYYASIQYFYRQNRASEINNGALVSSGPGGEAGGGVSLDDDLDLEF